MRYRREIDGLRALAVLPVMLYHAAIPPFGGGFVGVDVFFVISGYLITSIVIADIDAGRFTIQGFYERRARRILPALFLVAGISCCVAAVLFLQLRLAPDATRDFLQSIGAVGLFASNVLFWIESGYFAPAADLKPLLHTWSLAVEEQFYVVFPLLLLLVCALWRRRLVWVIAMVALASLSLSEWLGGVDASANFYLSPSRAWELMLGALVALALYRRERAFVGRAIANVLVVLGLAMILVPTVTYHAEMAFPGLSALPPTVGTALVILFGTERTGAGRALGWRPLVALGLMSYSAYLWHQPLLAFARVAAGSALTMRVATVLLGVSLVLAWLSWRFVEQPFRDRRHFSRRGIFAMAATVSVAFVAIGAWGQLNAPAMAAVWQERMTPQQRQRWFAIEEALSPSRQVEPAMECHLWSSSVSEAFIANFDRCALRYDRAVFITGGSHGIDLYNAVSYASAAPFVVGVSRGYCRLHDWLGGAPPVRCPYEDITRFLTSHASNISILVYTQTPDRLYPVPFGRASIADISDVAVDQLLARLDTLGRRTGVPVVLLGPTPIVGVDVAGLDFRRPLDAQLGMYSSHWVSLSRETDDYLAEKARAAGVAYVSKEAIIRSRFPDELLVDGRITYSDPRHWSEAGERYFGARLVRGLDSLGYHQFVPHESAGPGIAR